MRRSTEIRSVSSQSGVDLRPLQSLEIQIEALLTPDQKTKFETMQQQMRDGMRNGSPEGAPGGASPPPPPPPSGPPQI